MVKIRKQEPHDYIRERLEELARLGVSLQDYVHNLTRDAPLDNRTKEVVLELKRLENRLAIVNEILYHDKMSLALERAAQRARQGYSSI